MDGLDWYSDERLTHHAAPPVIRVISLSLADALVLRGVGKMLTLLDLGRFLECRRRHEIHLSGGVGAAWVSEVVLA